ncbi:hypothetical protein niasHT_036189 [Heterodera trifolii]|uniref:Coatomer subunit gamma C-terminal domain-containing protein n=1 Tax=Heterodera trifolii TaxID=157864 RepID=A0ABD2INT7_9BILA
MELFLSHSFRWLISLTRFLFNAAFFDHRVSMALVPQFWTLAPPLILSFFFHFLSLLPFRWLVGTCFPLFRCRLQTTQLLKCTFHFPCECSNRVLEGKSSHQMLLCGVFRCDINVLCRVHLVMDPYDQMMSMNMVVR